MAQARHNKNTAQHLAFLQEFLGIRNSSSLDEVLEFFYSIPLWSNLGGLCIIHAAWHPSSMQQLEGQLGDNNRLTRGLLVSASEKGHPNYHATEILLKGLEYTLPDGVVHKDKHGNERSEVRYWFHKQTATSLGDIVVHPENFDVEVTRARIEDDILCGYEAEEPPVFVGHYWMGESTASEPAILTSNVACLDYSAYKGVELVAYRWSGERCLDNQNFVY